MRAHDDVLTSGCCAEAVADKNDECHPHKGGAEFEHMEKWIATICTYELRQESEKEDRELRIENIDKNRSSNSAGGTMRCVFIWR